MEKRRVPETNPVLKAMSKKFEHEKGKVLEPTVQNAVFMLKAVVACEKAHPQHTITYAILKENVKAAIDAYSPPVAGFFASTDTTLKLTKTQMVVISTLLTGLDVNTEHELLCSAWNNWLKKMPNDCSDYRVNAVDC